MLLKLSSANKFTKNVKFRILKQTTVKLSKHCDMKQFCGYLLFYQKILYFYIKSFFWQFMAPDILYKDFYKKTCFHKIIRRTGRSNACVCSYYAFENTRLYIHLLKSG